MNIKPKEEYDFMSLFFLENLIPLSSLQITTIDEAKRFYSLFRLGANVSLIFSGRTVKILFLSEEEFRSWC